jgi:hypothetical protein
MDSIAILDTVPNTLLMSVFATRSIASCTGCPAGDHPPQTQGLSFGAHIWPGAFHSEFILTSASHFGICCAGDDPCTGGQVDPSTTVNMVSQDRTVTDKILSNISVWMSLTGSPAAEGFIVPPSLIAVNRSYRDQQKICAVRFTRCSTYLEVTAPPYFVSKFAVPHQWTPKSISETAISKIRDQVGGKRILAAVSGGVDSTVAAALAYKAIGDHLVAVFVDTGLLRHGEGLQVEQVFQSQMGIELLTVDASSQFLAALRGVTDPESKRKIVGELFIRTFETQADSLGKPRFLLQGTVYPDVIESSAPDRNKGERIKSHHNVGALMICIEPVEPLRYLFGEVMIENTGLASKQVAAAFPGLGLQCDVLVKSQIASKDKGCR